MKLRLRSALMVSIFLLPALARGQVKFTTVVNSQEVGQRDYLQIQFIVENAKQIDDFDPPAEFPGFHVVEGPIQSTGMSVINGNMSQYKGLSYVLQPTRTGKFTIAGATAVVDGKKMRSNNIAVTVHPGGSGASGASPSNPAPFGGFPGMQPFGPDPFGPSAVPEASDREELLKPGENVKEKIRKNLFVRVQVDRNTCFVGEPIVATYKLYSRLNAESRVTRRPSLNGFSVYDMIDPGADAVSTEKVNGKDFTVHTIRKTQLIPLQSGSIDLDPVEVENTVHFIKAAAGRQEAHRSGDRLKDLLDQLSGESNLGPVVDENVTLDTKPLTITVKPLPEENKPADYNGAVGNFSIEASLSRPVVAAQDEATLHVVVKGKGNLPVITAPPVDWPAGIDAFDPTAKEEVNKTVVPMSGSKSFDYIFTARDSGHYVIPAVNISFFDPSSQTYKSANSGPMDLQVTPPVKRSRPAVPQPATAQPGGITGLWKDLLEITLGILTCLAALFVWRRVKKKPAPAAPAVKPEPVADLAPKMPSTAYVPTAPAPDPLSEARQYFENGDYKAFYREVNRAVWKAIGRKLDLPSSELNKLNIIRQLELRGWDATSVLALDDLLNECELNLYTPAYDTYNMQQLLRQAEWVLDRLA